MPKMIVTGKDLRYAGKQMNIGEVFEAAARDAVILRHRKKADYVKEPAVVAKPAPPVAKVEAVKQPEPAQYAAWAQPEQAQPTVVEPMSTENTPLDPPKRARYVRRDLRSED